MAVAADERGADSAARRLTRAREGATWVRGEAVQLGARGIEAERRWMAGIGTSAASDGARVPRLRSAGNSVRREEGNEQAKRDLAIDSAVESA